MAKRISSDKLIEFCASALVKCGLDTKDACVIADVLVTTDTWGVFSHGTAALGNYINAMRRGGIDPSAHPEVIAQGASWALIDGHSAMGMLNCSLAMDVAIEKARAATIAWVGVRNSSHFGAAGYYASLAGHRDMIGIAMSNADPNMVIPGARGHVIGNNPLAYAVPSSKKPLLLDIALSTAAFGKILNMKISGKSIPSTWITDADGLPTSDLQDWPAKGSLQPMAGHKGYGLALFVEILAGALTGSGVLGEVKSWVFQPNENSKLGQAFIAIDIGQIIPISVFKQRIDVLVHKIKNSPKAKGELSISVPGEMEWEKREDALKNGIPFPETILSTLATVAQDLGIDTSFLD